MCCTSELPSFGLSLQEIKSVSIFRGSSLIIGLPRREMDNEGTTLSRMLQRNYSLLDSFDSLHLLHIRRVNNYKADLMANPETYLDKGNLVKNGGDHRLVLVPLVYYIK